MPRTKRAAAVAASAAVREDAVSTTTAPIENQKELQLRNILKIIEDEESRLKQRLVEDHEAMDRGLAIMLAQIADEDLNCPAASDAKESLSADFANNNKLVSSTVYKPGPASSKRPLSDPASAASKRAAKGAKPVAVAAAAKPKTAPSKPVTAKPAVTKAPAARTVPAKQPPAAKKGPNKKASAPTTSAPATASTHESRPRVRRLTRQNSTLCSPVGTDADETCVRRPRTRSISSSSSSSAVLYQTPQHRAHVSMDSLAVTPKVDPYGPISLKRQPRQGEMALSMSGSPLMVNMNSQEPNIAVPVNNEVYCIMATEGPVPDIRGIDEGTREKLKTLRANLNQILGDV